MTKAQFIAAIEAKPNFIKWAKVPVAVETVGDIEKCAGVAYITTNDGRQLFNVWFLNDTVADEAYWQSHDTLEPEVNAFAAKQKALAAYLKSNFAAYFLVPDRVDLTNNWAEAVVYETSGPDIARSTVLVFKIGNQPINHRKVI